MKRCPSCGYLEPDTGDDFCPIDGRRLVDTANAPTEPSIPAAIASSLAPGGLALTLRTALACRTHVGLRRSRNQDAVAVRAAVEGGWNTLVVCDGVSASPYSDQAAQRACERVIRALHELATETLEADPRRALRQAIQTAHSELCDEAWGAGPPPGTTIVAALVRGERAAIGWVGDSRAYWVTATECEQLTEDHSWMNEVVSRGEMTLDEARCSPNAHAITRCLGPLEGPTVEPDTRETWLRGPGALVLCTDGLWNYTPTAPALAAAVHAVIEPGADGLAHALVEFALDQGGFDNVSVAVLCVQGVTPGA